MVRGAADNFGGDHRLPAFFQALPFNTRDSLSTSGKTLTRALLIGFHPGEKMTVNESKLRTSAFGGLITVKA